MSPKDQKIINANPTATPYELQMNFGISQGGFIELVAINDEKANNVLKAGTPRLSPNAHLQLPAQPVIQPFNASLSAQSQQVILRGKNGSGNGTLISRIQAEKMVRKYPQAYEIVG